MTKNTAVKAKPNIRVVLRSCIAFSEYRLLFKSIEISSRPLQLFASR